jgi:hypothetical protein
MSKRQWRLWARPVEEDDDDDEIAADYEQFLEDFFYD